MSCLEFHVADETLLRGRHNGLGIAHDLPIRLSEFIRYTVVFVHPRGLSSTSALVSLHPLSPVGTVLASGGPPR